MCVGLGRVIGADRLTLCVWIRNREFPSLVLSNVVFGRGVFTHERRPTSRRATFDRLRNTDSILVKKKWINAFVTSFSFYFSD
ncbi:Hypothetical protein, putative [Bodo saltans]|uniref:Uncharacterized protein n=1 Tax=Bodo saltans TaxID=75058 RepID=A0A0S4KKM4_BODSA|nr:Hypothetical protein, putative [Bodo saltans]|eukprot:CUM57936.1 Hypothetical protein, putative [Bodo saltans]